MGAVGRRGLRRHGFGRAGSRGFQLFFRHKCQCCKTTDLKLTAAVARGLGRRGGYSSVMSDYGDRLLSDDQIAALSPAQRRDLIQRLERPLDEVFPPAVARRMRRNRLTLMVVGAIGLILGLTYLAVTLPENYVAHSWPATWIAFDCVLIAFMI